MAKAPAKKRTTATPKPAARKAPKKAAKPAKKAKKAARRTTKAPAKRTESILQQPAPGPATTADDGVAITSTPAADEWLAVEPEEPAPPLVPLVAPMSVPRPSALTPFDPATGDWVPVIEPGAGLTSLEKVEPDAPKKSVAATVWTVVLGIDLALLALNLLVAIAIGLVLVFAPDSSTADDVRQSFEGGTARGLVLETLLVFTMMGIVPFLWVVNTRQQAWEGTKRYLGLHSPGKGFLQGLALTPALLVAVAVLSSLYILITEGPQGFDLVAEDDNPAVQSIVDNLTLPIAFLIAFCAGVGEEILFRGVLIKRIGVWGQALTFGLMHALGGYVPQILFATALGVGFGYLRKRGWSLVALITAHAMYDLVLLLLTLAYA